MTDFEVSLDFNLRTIYLRTIDDGLLVRYAICDASQALELAETLRKHGEKLKELDKEWAIAYKARVQGIDLK